MCFPAWSLIASFGAGLLLMLAFWLTLVSVALRHRPWSGQTSDSDSNYGPDDCESDNNPYYTSSSGNGHGTISVGEFTGEF